jgi:hypothetical protein
MYKAKPFKTQSKFECKVQHIIENLTKHEFPTAYPPWLKYKGRQLELDGYSDKLKIAFEAQGPMHRRLDSRFDECYDRYYRRLENDAAKKILCDKNNVDLITVDYDLPKNHIETYIKSRLYDICKKNPTHPLCKQFSEKPMDYLIEFLPEVYRNKPLEKELNLSSPIV